MDPTAELVSNFTGLDWGIVVVYLLATVAVGLYANRYIENMDDYVVAGRSLKSHLSVATMLGSEIGLVTVMYAAQKGFTNGFAAFHIGLISGLICLFVGLSGFIVVPLRRTGAMTIPGYYGQRFGKSVRLLGGVILVVAGILNMGVFLKAAGLFVTAITGMDDPLAVNIVMVVLIALVLLYTILGGMVSVVITDYLQFVVLSFGMIAVCILAVGNLGWEPVVEAVKEIHGKAGFDPLDGEGFGPSQILWLSFYGLVACAIWPTAVMRVCAAKDTDVVRHLYRWSAVGFMTRFIIPQFLGICALAWMWQQGGADSRFFTADGALIDGTVITPDGTEINSVDETLRAMPLFLSQILPVGVIGLLAAGMLAAFMSTHDSYLLCWAAILVEDVVAPATGDRLTTRQRLLLSRIFIFLTGIFLLAWSMYFPMKQDMLNYLAVSGAIYFTGAFAVLLLGLYWKGASRTGAMLAMIAGLFNLLGLPPVREGLGLTDEKLGVEIHDAHIGLSIIAVSLVLMVLGSLLFPDKHPPGDSSPDPEPNTKGES